MKATKRVWNLPKFSRQEVSHWKIGNTPVLLCADDARFTRQWRQDDTTITLEMSVGSLRKLLAQEV